MRNAIILCSGGLDSVVTSYYTRILGYNNIIVLFFNYNQKSLILERKCSKRCAKNIKAKFNEINLKWLGDISLSLINKNNKAKNKVIDLGNTKKESYKYYVPCRNTIFITYALALAESLFIKEKRVYDIFLGFKCEGKDSYPDTTKEFVKEMNQLSKISCSHNFKIVTPLINKDKEDIIILGKKLNVDFKDTFSCYKGKKIHCGYCLACKLRQAGFYWADIKDTTIYRTKE